MSGRPIKRTLRAGNLVVCQKAAEVCRISVGGSNAPYGVAHSHILEGQEKFPTSDHSIARRWWRLQRASHSFERRDKGSSEGCGPTQTAYRSTGGVGHEVLSAFIT